jgi:hypothetical protein
MKMVPFKVDKITRRLMRKTTGTLKIKEEVPKASANTF